MRSSQHLVSSAIAMALLASTSSYAQISPATKDSISTPNIVETSIGTLRFIDGAPHPETARKVYDHLDTMRGVDAFLKGLPGASLHAMVKGINALGAVQAHQVIIADKLLDARSFWLTANTTTMYVMPTLDLERDGPTVVEVPPGMLGMFDNAWFRHLGDIGPFGQDKFKGGKYLVLPPHYQGKIPQGYFIIESDSYEVLIIMRAFTKNGLAAAAGNIKKNLRVYPLALKDNQPAMEFISTTNKTVSTIHANNFEFYNEVNEVIQKEPLSLLSPELRGLYAAIGIEKGKLFNPDPRMKKLLIDAVAIANATARANVWYPRVNGTMKGIEIYPGQNSSWNMGWVDKNVFFNGQDKHTMNSDARSYFHYFATGITPAMAVSIPGKGSDYAIAFTDAARLPFDGSKYYKLHIPANVPAKDFWSITLYDTQTRSLLQNNQTYPALDSLNKSLTKNSDGSYELYFGPKPPPGKESNWIETIDGKSWFSALRIYGPTKAWIDKSWRPGEIELVN
jgi:hypothetical protein